MRRYPHPRLDDSGRDCTPQTIVCGIPKVRKCPAPPDLSMHSLMRWRADGMVGPARWSLVMLVFASSYMCGVGSHGAQRDGVAGWVACPGRLLHHFRSRSKPTGIAVTMCPRPVDGLPDPGDLQKPPTWRQQPSAVPTPSPLSEPGKPRFSVRRAIDSPVSAEKVAAQQLDFSSPRNGNRGARGSYNLQRQRSDPMTSQSRPITRREAHTEGADLQVGAGVGLETSVCSRSGDLQM